MRLGPGKGHGNHVNKEKGEVGGERNLGKACDKITDARQSCQVSAVVQLAVESEATSNSHLALHLGLDIELTQRDFVGSRNRHAKPCAEY